MVQIPSLRIGVVGAGYLGAVHAACMADLGHRVVAVDVDLGKVERLSLGRPPFYEPGLEGLLEEVLPSGRLRFTSDFGALAGSEVVFLCVGTPLSENDDLDLTYLTSAVVAIAPHLTEGTLVVGKSTVPVGTAAHLKEVLSTASGGARRLAWSPEFLREGHAIDDTLRPSRLVYGVEPPTAEDDARLLDRVYAQVLASGTPRMVTDLATAELVKGAANAFLATKISFINSIADICEESGGDVVALARALGLDDRIGASFLNAGLGFGGGCLPKDVRGFAARALELGVPQHAALLGVVDQINRDRRARVVQRAMRVLDEDVAGKQIAVLGFAFKPGSDDIRDSAALEVADELARRGAIIKLHDPKAEMPLRPSTMQQVATPVDAVLGADLVLHLTEWPEYSALRPADLVSKVRKPLIVDARNRLTPFAWTRAGWTYLSIGQSQYLLDTPADRETHSAEQVLGR